MIKYFTIFTLAFFLNSCSSAPPKTYDLIAITGQFSKARTSGQIIIEEPNTIALYDTPRMVVRSINQGYTYLPQVQWADRLPKLVQARLIQSFENASHYKSVGRATDHINAGVLLVSDVRRFEIDEQSHEAIVEISVKLINAGEGRIEVLRVFTARMPVSSIDGNGSSVALNEALQGVLRQIVSFAK